MQKHNSFKSDRLSDLTNVEQNVSLLMFLCDMCNYSAQSWDRVKDLTDNPKVNTDIPEQDRRSVIRSGQSQTQVYRAVKNIPPTVDQKKPVG